MLKWYLVLEKPHVIVITLESMTQDEQVNSNKVTSSLWRHFVISFENLLFTKLLATFHHLDKLLVFVDSVAFLKYDWAYFIELFLKTWFLYSELWCWLWIDQRTSCASFWLFPLLDTSFASYPCHVDMCVTDLLVFILWQQRKVCRWNHLSKDTLCPLVPRLLLIFDWKILAYKSWSNLDNFNDLVL